VGVVTGLLCVVVFGGLSIFFMCMVYSLNIIGGIKDDQKPDGFSELYYLIGFLSSSIALTTVL
jgi:hypothetical protein